MPAYIATVETDEGSDGRVYFVDAPIYARRGAANYFNEGELGGVHVHRARGLDKYEESVTVPFWEMAARGWWSECWECDMKVSEDSDDMDDAGLNITDIVGDFGSAVYCCQKHKDDHQEDRETRARLSHQWQNKMMAIVEGKYGAQGITFGGKFAARIEMGNDGLYLEGATVWFGIPGCKIDTVGLAYNMGAHMCKPAYTLHYFLDQQDIVKKFIFERTGKTLDIMAEVA
jgi:hypothetical protein